MTYKTTNKAFYMANLTLPAIVAVLLAWSISITFTNTNKQN